MKTYPFEATAFTSEPSSHMMPTSSGVEAFVRFVLDLDRLIFAKNPCVVDFNHDSNDVIGVASLAVEQGALLAKGSFCSAVDGDRAFQVGEVSGAVPFGVSPTLALDGSTLEEIAEGAQGVANGRIYDGPLSIFRDVTVLGVSVCPYPTDAGTSISPLVRSGIVQLSQSGVKIMNEEIEKVENPVPIDEESTEQLGDETGVQDGALEVRDKELQAFLDEFGLEKGVGFFQRGLNIDDARMEDYQELKRLASAEGAEEEKQEELESDAAASEEDKEDETTSERLSRFLSAADKKLSILDGLIQRLARTAPPIGSKSSPSGRPSAGVKRPSYEESVIKAIGAK